MGTFREYMEQQEMVKPFREYLEEQGIIKPYNEKTFKGLSLGYQFFQLPSLDEFEWAKSHELDGSLGYLGVSTLSFLNDTSYIEPFEFADTVEEVGQLMGGN